MLNSLSFGSSRAQKCQRSENPYNIVRIKYTPAYSPIIRNNCGEILNLKAGAKVVDSEGFFKLKGLLNSRQNMLSHAKMDVTDWLNQFDCTQDRNLALKILQNYVYIDLDNARKAYRKVYKDLEAQDGFDFKKTKFATLGTGKSGSMMAYLFRQANKMRSKGTVVHQYSEKNTLPKEEKVLDFSQLQNVEFNKNLKEKGFENLVIIDDIIGDGDSLIEYFTPELVESLKQYKNIYYATLVKDPDGEKKVHKEFPDLNIKFITAQEVHKYDSPENKTFTDKEKVQIKEMVKKYGEKIKPELVDKYSRSKLFISFDWNTPGNTPMLFNLNTDKWKGLFPRYNGLEKDDVGTKFDFAC